MNFNELADVTRTEEVEVQFLEQNGLLHNPRLCSNGHAMVLNLGDRER